MNPKILITGGAGYIGSHTCVELLTSGYDLVVIDNLCNSKLAAIRCIEKLCGKAVEFHKLDIRNREPLREVFRSNSIKAVIHFAGLKAVGESVKKPLDYYDTNVMGSLVLFETMMEQGIKNLVFSSSATVYGDPHEVPIAEEFPLSVTNPYGRSKLMVEDMLRDIYQADNSWRIALLRYFNPVGAHESGLIGEDPNGMPNNLMPIVCQVAVGKRPSLSVYGNDYPTRDGTGVRDYIHVTDLASGHVRALDALLSKQGLLTLNLGTGNGYTVLEVVHAFELASGRPIAMRIADRRAGDIAECYADPRRAQELLDWRACRTLEQMCEDAWRWQSKNPHGYPD